jgi:peptidoglycan-N-acetylglucosamine deacetylase
MSVDLDEWYQGRLFTGLPTSLWLDTKTFYQDYYKSDGPKGEMIEPTQTILDLFSKNNINATFFVTAEIAQVYPSLIRKIKSTGHEIGCHNLYHRDYGEGDETAFADDLANAKNIIEEISGEKIIGYRAPNSTVCNYMIAHLKKMGFLYDSSVTSTWPIMGKFKNSFGAPINPYQLSKNKFSKSGDSALWEFPWPNFPIIRLPSGSGIMARIAGYPYTIISLDNALKTGDSSFYFHPFEIFPPPEIIGASPKIRLFFRNMGEPFLKMLQKLIRRYQGQFVSGRQLLEKHLKSSA